MFVLDGFLPTCIVVPMPLPFLDGWPTVSSRLLLSLLLSYWTCLYHTVIYYFLQTCIPSQIVVDNIFATHKLRLITITN